MLPAVKIKQMQYAWEANAPVLLDIEDLEIRRAERVFFRGPSGSGKTTFLGLLGGVLSPKQGSIEILGTALEKLSSSQRDSFRADHIGFIFQMFNLLPYLTVSENIDLALRFSKRKLQHVQKKTPKGQVSAEIDRILKALGLTEVGFADKKVSHLSVGQQQRVAVARALIGQPEIIVADEPTSALDSQSRKAFLSLLFDECEKAGSTLIYVSHDEDVGRRFDRSIDIADFKPLA